MSEPAEPAASDTTGEQTSWRTGELAQAVLIPVQPAAPPSAIAMPSKLGDKLVAPSVVASMAPLVKQMSETTWQVPMGAAALEAFLYHSGSTSITRYNLGVQRRTFDAKVVQRHAALANCKHSFTDVYSLNASGQTKLRSTPSKQAFLLELRCLGVAKHGRANPNCMHACGGFGMCTDGCEKSDERWHKC